MGNGWSTKSPEQGQLRERSPRASDGPLQAARLEAAPELRSHNGAMRGYLASDACAKIATPTADPPRSSWPGR